MTATTETSDRDFLLSITDYYRSDTRIFVAWCDSQGLPYNVESLEGWIAEQRYNGYSSATVRRRFYAIKTRLRLLIHRQNITEDDRALELYNLERRCREIKLPKKAAFSVKPTKFFTLDELRKLIKQSPPRVGMWIEFLYTTGMRIDEACKIQLRNVREESKNVYSIRITGKGGKERIVYINSGLRRRLRDTFHGKRWLFETRNGTGFDERNVWRMLRKSGEEILGRVLTPHCLRHSFTAHKIRETGKITGVSLYLGHSDISTTLGEYNNELLHPEEIMEGGLWGARGAKAKEDQS